MLSFRTLVLTGVLAGTVLGWGTSLPAQQAAPAFKQYPPTDPWTSDPKIVKALQTEVLRLLRNASTLDDAGKSRLDQWYKNYFFRLFTTEENWGKLTEFRTQLVDRDLRGAKNKAASDHVTNLTLALMTRFAQGQDLHPAVRYNAMLIIGDLNAVERGARGADGRPTAAPDPLPAALNILITEYKSPTQIDGVRLAALLGILRHAQLDLARPANRRIPAQTKQALVAEMLGLVNAPPPAGRTPEGHVWMQRRGIEILGALEAVGQDPAVGAALESIVANDQAPMSLRVTAAEALGRWAPTGKAAIDIATVSRQLGALAGAVFKQELSKIDELKESEELKEQIRTLLATANMGFTNTMSYGSESEYGAEAGYGGSSDPSYGAMMMQGMNSSSYGNYGSSDMEAMMSGSMGAMESMYGGMMGYGMTGVLKPADPRVDRSRRRLKYQLVSIKSGLDGLAKVQQVAQNPAQKDALAKVQAAVDACLEATDPPPDKVDLEGFTKWIGDNLKKLATFMPKDALADLTETPLDAPPPVASPAPSAPGAVPPTPGSAPAAAAPTPPGDPTAPAAAGATPSDLPPGVSP